MDNHKTIMEAGKNIAQSGAGSEPQADWIIIVVITVFPIGYREYTHTYMQRLWHVDI